MKHKPYPKYKDSGVEWLGKVPEAWEVWKIGHLTTKIGSGKTPTGGAEVYQSEGVLFIRSQNVYDEGLRLGDVVFIDSVMDEEMAWARVQAHDILLNITGASLGRTCIVPKDMPPANVNQHVCIIRMRNRENADYVSWYLKSNIAKNFYDIAQTGSAREGLNFEQISSIQTLLPALPEQQAIASYLAHKTAKIDALIDKKQDLVHRLREKRSALISHAVTKGLDPKAKKKPSGVAWLGEVPVGWEIIAIRRASCRVQTGTTPPTAEAQYYEDGTIPWYGPSSFKESLYLDQPVKMLNEQAIIDGVARLFQKGTVMIVGIGATIGKVGAISSNASCNQQITGITFDKVLVDTSYITYQLKLLEKTIRALAPSATLAIFDQNEISDLLIAIPPFSEQQAIAAFLDRETGKIDSLVSKVETAIGKLKEYRSALISAAVTGKIDVRGMTE